MPREQPGNPALSNVKVVAQKVTRVRSEILVLGFFQDVRPLTGLAGEIDWIHSGILSRLILRSKIRGVLGEAILLATQRKLHAHKILMMGLGEKNEFTDQVLQEIYSRIFKLLSQLQVKDCAMELFNPSDSSLDGVKAVKAVLRTLPVDANHRMDMTLLVPDSEKAQRVQQQIAQWVGTA